MKVFLATFVLISLTITSIGSDATSDVPVASHRTLRDWNGRWSSSDEMNHLLGFNDDDSRSEAQSESNQPVGFELTLSEQLGEGFDRALFEIYRDGVFRRLQHRIVATGQWKLEFREPSGVESSNCFVTESQGATYLWVPANWVVIYGGKISLIQGRSDQFDTIVIDFNSLGDSLRSYDTVAFRRVRQ